VFFNDPQGKLVLWTTRVSAAAAEGAHVFLCASRVGRKRGRALREPSYSPYLIYTVRYINTVCRIYVCTYPALHGSSLPHWIALLSLPSLFVQSPVTTAASYVRKAEALLSLFRPHMRCESESNAHNRIKTYFALKLGLEVEVGTLYEWSHLFSLKHTKAV